MKDMYIVFYKVIDDHEMEVLAEDEEDAKGIVALKYDPNNQHDWIQFTGVTKISKADVLHKGKDYDSSVKEANEPDHDLEYHDKKCEEVTDNENSKKEINH